jgi:capsular polysaccharide biosynthesis protein
VTLRVHALTIKRGWKLIVALVLLGAVCGALLTLVKPAQYVSSTRFFVASSVSSADPEELFNRNQIAAQRVKSYVELMVSDAMRDAVAEEVGPDVSLDDEVTVTGLPETVIIDVQVRATSPEDAQQLAQAYATVAPGLVSDVESVGTAKAAQVALTVIEEPEPGERESATLIWGLLSGALLGLVLGVGGVVLWGAVRRESQAGGTQA